MRMIKDVKKGKPDGQVQILLFSATFDDSVRTFAHNIVGGAANQVSMAFLKHVLCDLSVTVAPPFALTQNMFTSTLAWQSC